MEFTVFYDTCRYRMYRYYPYTPRHRPFHQKQRDTANPRIRSRIKLYVTIRDFILLC